MNTHFDDYDQKYPDLILDILDYFSLCNGKDIHNKSVLKFIEQFAKPFPDGKGMKYVINPQIVNRICGKLYSSGIISKMPNSNSIDGIQNNYVFVKRNSQDWNNIESRNKIRHFYNSFVYGFKYIYSVYKETVLPIVFEKDNGDYTIGTGFKIWGGIATAK